MRRALRGLGWECCALSAYLSRNSRERSRSTEWLTRLPRCKSTKSCKAVCGFHDRCHRDSRSCRPQRDRSSRRRRCRRGMLFSLRLLRPNLACKTLSTITTFFSHRREDNAIFCRLSSSEFHKIIDPHSRGHVDPTARQNASQTSTRMPPSFATSQRLSVSP